MLKSIFISAGLAASLLCHAQKDTEETKMFNQYIGVQANQLFRQIINLNNNNNTAINNPYLLTYSINLTKCGWGIQAGIGYNYQKITDKDLPVGRETKFSDLSYRIGIGRKVRLGKKLEAG